MPDTNRFQVLARPKMVHRANVGSRLDYVEFFASHEAEDLRIWGWQRTNSTSCSILSNHQNWLQISSVNCMKGPPWLYPETTVPPNSFCLDIASPLGNHRGPRAFLVTGMRNTPRKSPPTLCCSGASPKFRSGRKMTCFPDCGDNSEPGFRL